ncbi:leucine zipper protein 1 [Rana temporaria]|uniref:leucine zipper protein 1 n=1 Tax=Rana temporaria TaxID=8407 RepID=UPI001AAD1406|nr:leucine zipper protein 1 [Rana temporaria]XP_040193059.1 leucine zipper protein 1 [Rana temporaria]XP_040193060.1 leucine zipper protein 1 [Rana temporaria]XP_040193061.1 leucine zipper protein 1 [Rana temporaria]
MEHSSRHLRFKLQSLSRRLDDLEEATRNLQKAEDEVLDLQDKIIQAEGSNSSMLAEAEGLRKRVMKLEGKDEEVKKAEDLCRLIKEKLENEENITRELRLEIEQLQKRMSELEKLEDSFSKSKSDCSQLCLGLNEEKNMSKKLSSELELLRTRVRELESSESRLDKAEQLLTSELEKIKTLTLSFVNERKRFLEREKQNEKLILELKEQLEVKEKTGEQSRNESNLLERPSDQHGEHNSFKIEDTLTSKISRRVGSDYVKQSEIQTSSENEKNKHQEDNKIKELNQEIEKLKNQFKHFADLEEELKELKEKNCELQDNVISEQNKNKQVTDELQTLKRQANEFREVENGVLESDDLSHNQIKIETNRMASTEPPISKYTPRDESPQHLRRERSRNTESLYKRQLSNSSSSSRKSSRSPLNDTTIGNLRKPEDKISVSYFSSGKDFGSTQNDIKKLKDQPSVLSRYPPAVQEQSTPKSWKASTGKQTDRSMKLFGEDYSSKANSKKEISLDNVEIKGKPFLESFENKVTTNVHEEIIPAENCSVSSTLCSDWVNHSSDLSNAEENGDFNVENELGPRLNSEDAVKSISKYPGRSGGDGITNDNGQNETKQKSIFSNKEEFDSQSNSTLNSQRSYYTREKSRSKSSKPLIPEKPHMLESLDYREPDRKGSRLSGLHTKRQSSPKERMALQENLRTSSFENHGPSLQTELVTESFRNMSSFDGLDTEISSHTATRTRSCSPRESLQSTMIIKPIIIEKDIKESMSDYRARSSSESSRSQVNLTPNKVTTSIKIYPSEAISRTSTDDPTRERHTSTSNIRLSANDQAVLKNNISIPFEISINKEDMLFKVSNTDKTLDHKEMTRASEHRLRKERAKGTDNELEREPMTWKSHKFETNHVDSKRGTAKSSWRKGVYGSTEELDRIDRDFSETKSRRKSCFDEEKKPVRMRNHELYSRNKSSSVSSWSTTPEFISKRSQSTLTATEIVSRRNVSNDSLSGYSSWSRSSVEVDDSFNSRRKYTSERPARTDSAGWRQAQNPRQKGMVEERIRQLEH